MHTALTRPAPDFRDSYPGSVCLGGNSVFLPIAAVGERFPLREPRPDATWPGWPQNGCVHKLFCSCNLNSSRSHCRGLCNCERWGKEDSRCPGQVADETDDPNRAAGCGSSGSGNAVGSVRAGCLPFLKAVGEIVVDVLPKREGVDCGVTDRHRDLLWKKKFTKVSGFERAGNLRIGEKGVKKETIATLPGGVTGRGAVGPRN